MNQEPLEHSWWDTGEPLVPQGLGQLEGTGAVANDVGEGAAGALGHERDQSRAEIQEELLDFLLLDFGGEKGGFGA